MIGDGSERAEQSRLERRRLAMSHSAQPTRPENLLSKVSSVPDAGCDLESHQGNRKPDVRRPQSAG